MFEIAIAAAISAACALVVGFFTGRKFPPRVKPGSTAEGTSAPVPESGMAVTEFEIIEAFSPLQLPEEVFDSMRQKVHNMQQLKAAVTKIRSDAFDHVRDHIKPQAAAYAESISRKEAKHVAAAIIAGQMVAPLGTVHPAFSSMAAQVNCTNPLMSKLRDWKKNWNGAIPIEPTADHLLAVKGCSYGEIMCTFDPCRTEEERAFWEKVAITRIDDYVHSDREDMNKQYCFGDLFAWSPLCLLDCRSVCATFIRR